MARARGNATAREASLLPVVLALVMIVVVAAAAFAILPQALHLSHSVGHLKSSSPTGP